MFVVAAVSNSPSVNVVAAGVIASAATDTLGGISSVGVAGTVQAEVGLSDGVATGGISLTPPAGVDGIKSSTLVSAVAVKQGDTAAGEAMHAGAGDAAEETSASVVTCVDT